MTEKKTAKISVYLSKELRDDLAVVADYYHVSITELANIAFQEYVNRRPKIMAELRRIRTALNDIPNAESMIECVQSVNDDEQAGSNDEQAHDDEGVQSVNDDGSASEDTAGTDETGNHQAVAVPF